MKYLLIIATLVTLGAGCAGQSSNQAGGYKGVRPAAARAEDAIYVIEGKSVPLVDGHSTNGSSSITRVFGVPVKADLDADGDLDAAVMLSVDTPGSGTFYYVAAALDGDLGFVGTQAVLLGDRVAPQTLEVRDGAIIANYADRKPGEPMTAKPSVGVSKHFSIEGGELKEVTKP